MMILTGVLFRKSFTPFNILLYRLHFVTYAAKSDPDSRLGFRICPGSRDLRTATDDTRSTGTQAVGTEFLL